MMKHWYDHREIVNISYVRGSSIRFHHEPVHGRVYLKEGDEVEVVIDTFDYVNGQWWIESTGNNGNSFYLVDEWGQKMSVHLKPLHF